MLAWFGLRHHPGPLPSVRTGLKTFVRFGKTWDFRVISFLHNLTRVLNRPYFPCSNNKHGHTVSKQPTGCISKHHGLEQSKQHSLQSFKHHSKAQTQRHKPLARCPPHHSSWQAVDISRQPHKDRINPILRSTSTTGSPFCIEPQKSCRFTLGDWRSHAVHASPS